MNTRFIALGALGTALLLVLPAEAQEAQPGAVPSPPPVAPVTAPLPTDSSEPRVLHTPIDSAPPDQPLVVSVEAREAGRLAHLTLHIRSAAGEALSTPFERQGPTSYVATIPRAFTAATRVAYAIESTDRDGRVRAHFATPAAPHWVDLHGRGESARQRAQLERYRGHRNEARVETELVAFGGREEAGEVTDDYSDAWIDVQAQYVYRPLTLVHDIRFGAGFMRASLPEVDGKAAVSGRSPGLNYGLAEVNVELLAWFSVGGRLVLGANEEGFVVGAGGVFRLGDMAGNHLAVDLEAIGDVGGRRDIRFHWTTVPGFPMALGVTFTDWPDERLAGQSTLLSYDLGIHLTGGTRLALRVGAANRPQSIRAGVLGGLGLSHSF
ncbi:MAG: hypothetical protein R3F60_21090 [bacterium]